MTAQKQALSVGQLLIDTFADWLKHRRELSEIRQMDTYRFRPDRRRPADIRATISTQLVRQGPHAADELPEMLKALGIDEDKLARTEPLVLRDMERVCAMCTKSANATATSPPAPPPNIMRTIAQRFHHRRPRQAGPSLGTGTNPATET